MSFQSNARNHNDRKTIQDISPAGRYDKIIMRHRLIAKVKTILLSVNNVLYIIVNSNYCLFNAFICNITE
jgi:hypothetical protein